MATATKEHVHTWQANGIAELDRTSYSPSSVWDDVLYTDVLAIATCACGATQRTRVGQKNVRRRGDKPGESTVR